jgi:hypothetical protein
MKDLLFYNLQGAKICINNFHFALSYCFTVFSFQATRTYSKGMYFPGPFKKTFLQFFTARRQGPDLNPGLNKLTYVSEFFVLVNAINIVENPVVLLVGSCIYFLEHISGKNIVFLKKLAKYVSIMVRFYRSGSRRFEKLNPDPYNNRPGFSHASHVLTVTNFLVRL